MAKISTAEKIQSLPWFYTFQSTNIVFVLLTVFGPTFPMFLDQLGLTKPQIGFILALPFLVTVISPLAAGWILRQGVKRTFIKLTSIRTGAIAGLLLAPLFARWLTVEMLFFFVVSLMFVFSVCRAIAETGYISWEKELIPDNARGKITAVNGVIANLTAIGSSLLAAFFLRQAAGISAYSVLILIGICGAIASLVAAQRMPGGAPVDTLPNEPIFAQIAQAWHNVDFRRFLLANGLFFSAAYALTLLPLFMRHQLQLTAGTVMLTDVAARAGTMLASFFWGWSADRFGSRPIATTGVMLFALVPLGIAVLTPEMTALPIWLSGLYFFQGIMAQGYMLGMGRYFYVDILTPRVSNVGFYILYYVGMGIASAIGPWTAGLLLKLCEGLNFHGGFFMITPFTPLLLLTSGALFTCSAIFHRLPSTGSIPTRRFLALLAEGHPLLALGSILRYQFAWDEPDRVHVAESIGHTRNAATVAELLMLLRDPSFNVRQEAVLAIARMPRNPALTDALINILRNKEPDLSISAGWALGRLGDPRAVPALREALQAEYAMLRARAARSLALLHDQESAPAILDALRREDQDSIKVAYATALGSLRHFPALSDILTLLERLTAEPLRNETALAAARMFGGERHFIRLWRNARHDTATACINALQKIVWLEATAYAPALQAVLRHLHENALAAAGGILADILRRLSEDGSLTGGQSAVAAACRAHLLGKAQQGLRLEYLILAINLLHLVQPALAAASTANPAQSQANQSP